VADERAEAGINVLNTTLEEIFVDLAYDLFEDAGS
jgi:hypothetical protein